MKKPEPITLSSGALRLEPLTPDHVAGLEAAACDGELWTLRVTSVPAPGETAAYVAAALKGQAEGHMLPFAVRDAVMYSLAAGERPEVKAHLDHRLTRPREGTGRLTC